MDQDTFPMKMQDLIDLSMKVAEHCPDLEISPDATIRSAITTINRAHDVPAPPAPAPSDLLPHQQRVVDEKTALEEKLGKLRSFFNSSTYAAMAGTQSGRDEQDRLNEQADVMDKYIAILRDRIAAF